MLLFDDELSVVFGTSFGPFGASGILGPLSLSFMLWPAWCAPWVAAPLRPPLSIDQPMPSGSPPRGTVAAPTTPSVVASLRAAPFQLLANFGSALFMPLPKWCAKTPAPPPRPADIPRDLPSKPCRLPCPIWMICASPSSPTSCAPSSSPALRTCMAALAAFDRSATFASSAAVRAARSMNCKIVCPTTARPAAKIPAERGAVIGFDRAHNNSAPVNAIWMIIEYLAFSTFRAWLRSMAACAAADPAKSPSKPDSFCP
jgi:hypothetical protein